MYSIELPNKERHEELGYAEHATRCLETLKDYLAAHATEGAAGDAGQPASGARRAAATT